MDGDTDTDDEEDHLGSLYNHRPSITHYRASRESMSSTDESLRPRTSITPSSSDMENIAEPSG